MTITKDQQVQEYAEKKLNADYWRSILYKFTSDEALRPGIQEP